MENNIPTQPSVTQQSQTPVNPVSQQPGSQPMQSSSVQNSNPSSSKGALGKKFVLLAVAVLLFLGIVGGGYYLFLNSSKTRNANVYTQPTTLVTPTPQAYQSNPKDTSNQAISNDTQVSDQNLKNLDSSLNSVDQSLSDQQVNLQ